MFPRIRRSLAVGTRAYRRSVIARKRRPALPFILSLVFLAASQAAANEGSGDATASELMRIGRYDQAESLLRQSLADDPLDANISFLLGFALANQGKWDEAVTHFATTVSLVPDHLRAHQELAGCLYKLGHNDEAITVLKRAVAIDPDDLYTNSFLASLLYLRKETFKALFYWNKAGKPRIQSVSYNVVASRLDARRLMSAFHVNEGEVLSQLRVRTLAWKWDRLGLGPPLSWNLRPAANGLWALDLDAHLSGSELSWPDVVLQNLVSSTVHSSAEVDLRLPLGTGPRLSLFARWKPYARRANVGLQMPVSIGSKLDTLTANVDILQEQWSGDLFGTSFEREAAALMLSYQLLRDNHSLSTKLGYRKQELGFHEPMAPRGNLPHLVEFGLGWQEPIPLGGPAVASSEWGVQLATYRGWSKERASWGAGLEAHLVFSWSFRESPGVQLRTVARGAVAAREPPLDLLYVLGVGQDADVLLRAHPTLSGGEKGSSPLAGSFVGLNVDLMRERLARWRYIGLGASVFLDLAAVGQSPNESWEDKLFCDIGAELVLTGLGTDLLRLVIGVDTMTRDISTWLGVRYRR